MKKRKCPYFLDWSKVKFHFEGPKNFIDFFPTTHFRRSKKQWKQAKIKKVRALSFLQFFMKFNWMPSNWHFSQDLGVLRSARQISFFFDFFEISQNRPSAKNHGTTSKTEAIILNYNKNWRRESALIFLIKAAWKKLWWF